MRFLESWNQLVLLIVLVLFNTCSETPPLDRPAYSEARDREINQSQNGPGHDAKSSAEWPPWVWPGLALGTGTRDRAIGARLFLRYRAVWYLYTLQTIAAILLVVALSRYMCSMNGLLAGTPPRDKGQGPSIPLTGTTSLQ